MKRLNPRRTSLSAASSADCRLVPATHVVSAVHGTRTVLLDPQRGRYYGLDELGSRIWELAAAGHTRAQIVESLLQEYDVERERLDADIARTLDDFEAKELMRAGGVKRAARPPGLISSLATVALIDVTLKLFGFSRAVKLARWLGGRRRPEPKLGELAAAVSRKVAMAGVFYPGRARCLEQSLALYVLLRRRGVGAELRLGVQPYPFNAHAWVELDGAPLNEQVETIGQFVPLQDFAV